MHRSKREKERERAFDIRVSQKYINSNLLSLVIGIGTHAIRIAILFPPKTFNDAPVDFCVMRRFDGVRRGLLGRELDKGVSLVFEHSYVLDGAERGERFLYQLVRDAVRKTPAVHGTVGRTTLVINLLENNEKTLRS